MLGRLKFGACRGLGVATGLCKSWSIKNVSQKARKVFGGLWMTMLEAEDSKEDMHEHSLALWTLLECAQTWSFGSGQGKQTFGWVAL